MPLNLRLPEHGQCVENRLLQMAAAHDLLLLLARVVVLIVGVAHGEQVVANARMSVGQNSLGLERVDADELAPRGEIATQVVGSSRRLRLRLQFRRNCGFLGTANDAVEAVVVARRDGLQLVIMAAGTRGSQAEKPARHRVDDVVA